VFRRIRGWSWDSLDYASLAFLLLPVAISSISQIFNPRRRYDLLIEAVSWYRWEEALDLLSTIRDRIPPDEGAFREAQALAGLGRLDEALERVRPFSEGSCIPEWLYWGRLAEVYNVAGRAHDEIGSMERAAELAPENPSVLLDLASILIRHRRDLSRAAALIERAKSHALSDVASPFVDRAEGLLALSQGNAKQAIYHLEKAVMGLLPFRGNPLVGLVTDRIHAYLALAHAKLGNATTAARHFKQAEPRLLATKADDLLRPCREAIGPA
jgi:tetratricopeptide (TPR) repeat protein